MKHQTPVQTSNVYWALLSPSFVTVGRSRDQIFQSILRARNRGLTEMDLNDGTPCMLIISPFPIKRKPSHQGCISPLPSLAMCAPYANIKLLLSMELKLIASCMPQPDDPIVLEYNIKQNYKPKCAHER